MGSRTMKRTLFAVMALLASGAALADECSNANTQTGNESVRGRAVSGGRQKTE